MSGTGTMRSRATMDPAHFRDKGIEWWTQEESSPHDSFVLPVLRDKGIEDVLEVGVGRGALSFQIRRIGKRVVGAEINNGFIQYCRDKPGGREIEFVQGNAEALPLRDATFDAVVCIEVLMHLPHPARAIAEMSRVTRPHGVVLVSYLKKYTAGHLKRVLQVATGRYEMKYGPRSFDYRYDAMRDIRQYVRGTGLAISEVSETAPGNPCVLLLKT